MREVSEWAGGRGQGRDQTGDRVPLRKAFIGWEAKGSKGWVGGFTKGEALRKADPPKRRWWQK